MISIVLLCDTDYRIYFLSPRWYDYGRFSYIFSDKCFSERRFIWDFIFEYIGFLWTDDSISDLLVLKGYHYSISYIYTWSFSSASFLIIDKIISSWLEYLFKFSDTKFYLCLLITSFLVFSIFWEVTIRDGFFQFCSDFDTFFFSEESEFFSKFSKSFTGKEDFFVSHGR